MSEAIVLRCASCGLPWARLQNGAIIVESRHHGEKHLNVMSVEELAKLREKESAPDERSGIIGDLGRLGDVEQGDSVRKDDHGLHTH